jgi:hypothetical protein
MGLVPPVPSLLVGGWGLLHPPHHLRVRSAVAKNDRFERRIPLVIVAKPWTEQKSRESSEKDGKK